MYRKAPAHHIFKIPTDHVSANATMDDVPDEPDLMSDTDTDSYSDTDASESESGGEVIVQASDSSDVNEEVAESPHVSDAEGLAMVITSLEGQSSPPPSTVVPLQVQLDQHGELILTPDQAAEFVTSIYTIPQANGNSSDQEEDRAAGEESDHASQRSSGSHHSQHSRRSLRSRRSFRSHPSASDSDPDDPDAVADFDVQLQRNAVEIQQRAAAISARAINERATQQVHQPTKHRRRKIKVKTITDHKTAGRYFQAGEYAQAEALYTKAITADPTAPLLYTNRAMARIKLGMYDSVVGDCEASLSLLPHNMKAYYYKAQALLAMSSPQEALDAGRKAYELAADSGDRRWERSLGNIVSIVLKCKKAVWEAKEKQRQRDETALSEQVFDLMHKQKRDEMEGADQIEWGQIAESWDKKIEEMKTIFANSMEGPVRKPVPDWMIDDITFAIMVDPVIVSALLYLPEDACTDVDEKLTSRQTKTGNSYERASIMEHLRRSHTDPLTRSPLSPEELRPNLALREACEQFLEENGWAVDY